MGKKEVMNASIRPFTLNNKEIKERIENAISYDHSKYKDIEIMFEKKNTNIYKLPFSDFKVAIAQELQEHQLLIQELQDHNLIEESVVEEIPIIPEEPEEKEVPIEEPEIAILDEIYDFDDEGKKPNKVKSKAKIKQVDTLAIVEKIKSEARERNKGKKVISFRDINKELKPYMIKKNNGLGINDDALTSIDIYLNAVNKIDTPSTTNSNDLANDSSLELNLDDILNDLDK